MMKRLTSRVGFEAACSLGILFVVLFVPLAFSDNAKKVPVGAVAAQLTGRLIGSGGINGDYEFLCYATFIEGLGTSLFVGDPSEHTAQITLRSDQFRFQAFANGQLIHFGRLALPDAPPAQVRVYYMASPNHDFSDPDSFSQGQLVGVLQSRGIQGSLTPSFGFEASGTLNVESASDVSIGGKRVNLRDLGGSLTASLHGIAPSAGQFGAGGALSIPLDGAVYSAAGFREASE